MTNYISARTDSIKIEKGQRAGEKLENLVAQYPSRIESIFFTLMF